MVNTHMVCVCVYVCVCCVSIYSIERSQGQHKKWSKSRKIGLTNSTNLVELLLREGAKPLKTASECLMTLFQFIDFFALFLTYFKANFGINCSFLCFTAWLVNIETQGQQCSVSWQQASHVEIYFFDQHYQPGNFTS